MGVHGLWRLIESSGTPVPLEQLENKVLAVDISIWLHQAVKGFQDSKGATIPNAHLLCTFHRLCKLLYYRIRPVFVFDGGVPKLKKQTIAKRNELKYFHEDESEKLRQQILASIIQQSAISTALAEDFTQHLTQKTKPSPKKNTLRDQDEDIFKLSELPLSQPETTPETDVTECECKSEDANPFFRKNYIDINTIDEKSEKFKLLPAYLRHDILSEMKENSKNSRWKDIIAPALNGEFSQGQLKRLLKRRSIQLSLEEAEKEMGGHTLSMGELEAILYQEGIVTSSKMAAKRHVASDENTKYLLIKDLQKTKKELEQKKLEEIKEEQNKEEIKKAEQNKEEEQNKEKIKEAEQNNEEIKTEEQNKEEIKEPIDSKFESEISTKKDFQIDESSLDSDPDLAFAIQLSLSTESSSKRKTDKMKDINKPSTSKDVFETIQIKNFKENLDYDHDLQAAIQLSLEAVKNQNIDKTSTIGKTSKTSKTIIKKTKVSEDLAHYEKFNEHDVVITSSEDEIMLSPVAKGATLLSKAYLTEYSDLTPAEIEKLLKEQDNHKKELKPKDFFPNEMLLNTQTTPKKKEIATKTNKQLEDNKNENLLGDVGFLSQSDSDESNDLVEVADNFNNKIIQNSDAVKSSVAKSGSVLELVIKPEDKVEDDLFADIFTDKENKFQLEKIIEVKQKINETAQTTISKINENQNYTSPDNISPNKNLIVESTNIEIASKTQSETKLDNIFEPEKKISETENIESEVEIVQSKEQNPTIQENKIIPPKISKEELLLIKKNLEAQKEALIKEKAHEDRMATNITDQMYKETQDLLNLFGVPYIIAPMEAEAQCAYLDQINLTNGTITDDSDIWLFGGKTVYKNFFSNKKQVLEFRAENIKHNFKLSREQLILLALLVGSDYTLGIQGVGPVTALEILAAFPPSKHETILNQDELISGLQHFKNWWCNGRMVGPGKTALHNKLKNITLHEGFPNIQIVNAYLKPKVDDSEEAFTWGKPNLEKLREFAKNKFGWSEVKLNEIITPVLKRWQDPKSQKSILDYFNSKPVKRSEILLSKRIQKALNRLENNDSDSEENENLPKKILKTTSTKNKSSTDKAEPKKNKKRSKKKKIEEPNVVTEEISIKPLNKIQEKLKDFKNAPKKFEEFIPQREKDRVNALKTKLRAIELYRKSKYGPGFVNKKRKIERPVKEDAELSESSSD